MAKKGGNPQNLKPFKPGQSGNPNGRPKNRFTLEVLRGIIDRLAMMTRVELQAVIGDPKTPIVELQIASTLAQAVKSGDYSKIAGILERALGKVKDEIEVSTPTPFMLRRRNGEEVIMGIETKEKK